MLKKNLRTRAKLAVITVVTIVIVSSIIYVYIGDLLLALALGAPAGSFTLVRGVIETRGVFDEPCYVADTSLPYRLAVLVGSVVLGYLAGLPVGISIVEFLPAGVELRYLAAIVMAFVVAGIVGSVGFFAYNQEYLSAEELQAANKSADDGQ